jgi:hypothetical protein
MGLVENHSRHYEVVGGLRAVGTIPGLIEESQ